jgi:hypothetical protein|nr:MAG TPA: hypothetical protein [Caudoviricetes sp.]
MKKQVNAVFTLTSSEIDEAFYDFLEVSLTIIEEKEL